MNTRNELPQPQADRSIEGKIARLRERVAKAVASGQLSPGAAGVFYGLLDMLGDEL